MDLSEGVASRGSFEPGCGLGSHSLSLNRRACAGREANRAEGADTLGTDGDVDEEIRHLVSALTRSRVALPM